MGFNVELQKWNTAGSAAYPEALCEAIALDVVSALPLCMAMQGEHASVASTSTATATDQVSTEQVVPPPSAPSSSSLERTPNLATYAEVASEIVISSGDEQPGNARQQQEAETFDPATSACFGQPITCRYENCCREFTDGFGLCSPGRWVPGARNKLASGRCDKPCRAGGIFACGVSYGINWGLEKRGI